jgi:hypothetical protein
MGFAVCLLGICLAGSAQALSISGRSSTEIEWFDNADGDTAVPAYEYLLLNVKDIDGAGLNFRGYGRLANDLANEVDVDHRLYYAYLEKRELLPHLDVKIGRQFIATTAAASLMDGLYLKARDLGPFSLTVFGGGDVSYYAGYNAKDLIDGVELSGRFDTLQVGLSYVQRWEESELTNELIGFNADYDYRQQLSLFGEGQFNYLANNISYFNGGFDYHANPFWSLRAEYLYSLPVFSSTSIYSVYAVNEYQEVATELSFRHGQGVRSFLKYTREIYQELDDANVFEAGVEKIRTDRLSGYLSGVYRNDSDGQDLRGVRAHGSWLFNRYFRAGIGADLDVLQRRIEENDESTSSRVWVDATATFTKKINVEAKVERAQSDLWDEYYRGRVRLNILF